MDHFITWIVAQGFTPVHPYDSVALLRNSLPESQSVNTHALAKGVPSFLHKYVYYFNLCFTHTQVQARRGKRKSKRPQATEAASDTNRSQVNRTGTDFFSQNIAQIEKKFLCILHNKHRIKKCAKLHIVPKRLFLRFKGLYTLLWECSGLMGIKSENKPKWGLYGYSGQFGTGKKPEKGQEKSPSHCGGAIKSGRSLYFADFLVV